MDHDIKFMKRKMEEVLDFFIEEVEGDVVLMIEEAEQAGFAPDYFFALGELLQVMRNKRKAIELVFNKVMEDRGYEKRT